MPEPHETGADVDVDDDGDGDRDLSSRPAKRKARDISKACENCKIKKARCDSARPQCDPCRRKGISCSYKEKGQPGLKPGYGKAVEQRLSALEGNLAKVTESVQEVLGYLQGQSQQPAFDQTLPLTSSTLVPQEDRVQSDQQWQASWGQPGGESVNTTFDESPLVEILPQPQPLPDPEQGQADPCSPGIGHGDELPASDVVATLVDLYFDHVYPWAPLFNRESFLCNMFSPERRVLLHGIVVLSFRYWQNADPSEKVREEHMRKSRQHILVQTIDSCSLISTQALALLAIDALGQGPGPRTWNIMAMLVTSAKQLGLGRNHSQGDTKASLVHNDESDNDLNLSIIEAEEKCRLFWTIYSLDRFSSTPLGQSGEIDSKTIKLPYPVSDDEWGRNAPVEWFQGTSALKPSRSTNLWHHYIDLLSLVDRSNRFLLQPINLNLPANCQEWQSSFRSLNITLTTWFENLPRPVREPGAVFDPMWTLIHSTFYLINIRMYTVAMLPSTNSAHLRPSASARSHCRQAIRNVASLTTSIPIHELSRLGPGFAFSVWVAARSLIILWTTGYEITYGAMPSDLEALLSALRHMAVQWPCAQRYVDIIQPILDTKNSPGGPAGLDIFNDTKRTMYSLQNRLGIMARPTNRTMHNTFTNTEDFLDMPFLDVGDRLLLPNAGGTGRGFGMEFDGEWL